MTNSLIRTAPALTSKPQQPGPTRRERKRAQTRERIFRAAMELFATRGFLDTTVEDITEAADVGKGTFFNYFPSKEHVLGVLHDMQLSRVAEARAAAEEGNLSIHEVLRQFMDRIVEEPGRSQQLARGLIGALFSSEPIRELLVGTLSRGREVLAEVLKRGQERGEIRRDIAAADMARVFQQNILGVLLHWCISPPGSLKKRLEATFGIFWSGISQSHGVQS